MSTADADALDAARLGGSVLEAFSENQPPYFLPLARALVFYSSTRVALGVGFEHGAGFMITRFVYVPKTEDHRLSKPHGAMHPSGKIVDHFSNPFLVVYLLDCPPLHQPQHMLRGRLHAM